MKVSMRNGTRNSGGRASFKNKKPLSATMLLVLLGNPTQVPWGSHDKLRDVERRGDGEGRDVVDVRGRGALPWDHVDGRPEYLPDAVCVQQRLLTETT